MKPALFAMALTTFAAQTASAQDWNIEVFAGSGDAGNLEWNGVNFEMEPGFTYGIGISRNDVFIDNLEIGFEYSTVEFEYTDEDPNPNRISGDAFMITSRYVFCDNGPSKTYFGLGLGVIDVTYETEFLDYTNSETVAGGQVMLGGSYSIAERSRIFGEVRYQAALEDPQVAFSDASRTAEFNNTALILGLRQSF